MVLMRPAGRSVVPFFVGAVVVFPLSTQDQSELYQRAEEKLATAAEDSELKSQAEENARAMLTGLFSSLDIKATFADDRATK